MIEIPVTNVLTKYEVRNIIHFTDSFNKAREMKEILGYGVELGVGINHEREGKKFVVFVVDHIDYETVRKRYEVFWDSKNKSIDMRGQTGLRDTSKNKDLFERISTYKQQSKRRMGARNRSFFGQIYDDIADIFK